MDGGRGLSGRIAAAFSDGLCIVAVGPARRDEPQRGWRAAAQRSGAYWKEPRALTVGTDRMRAKVLERNWLRAAVRRESWRPVSPADRVAVARQAHAQKMAAKLARRAG